MGDPNEKFFKNLQANQLQQADQAKHSQQLKHEETLIKRICRAANYQPNWSQLSQDCYQQTDTHILNFNWFRQAYPAFPIRFGAASVAWAHKTSLVDLFKRFTRTVIFTAYQDWLAEQGLDDRRDGPVGFIFSMGTLGAVALHTFPRHVEAATDQEAAQADLGMRLVRPLGRPVVVYVIEQLDTLLAAIGSAWPHDTTGEFHHNG